MSYIGYHCFPLTINAVICWRMAIASLLLLSNHIQAQDVSIDWKTSNISTAKHYIVPHYQQLLSSTQDLHQHIKKVCRPEKNHINSKSHDITTLQNKFSHTYLQWARVQHIKFGPIAFLQRVERFQYWPDKHNVTSRQLRQLLQANEKTLTLEKLQNKSVAVQGLPSLERLIFSGNDSLSLTNSHDIFLKKCTLAQLISKNLLHIAEKTYQAWTKPPVLFINELALADADDGFYSSSEEIAKILFNSLTTQLKIIEQLKLAYALPKANTRAKVRHLEAWRSQLSLPIIKANLHSIYKLYQHAFSIHLQQKNAFLAQKIKAQFIRVNHLSRVIKEPLYTLAKQSPSDQRLIDLQQEIKKLYRLMAHDIPKTLPLNIAFNALDGD